MHPTIVQVPVEACRPRFASRVIIEWLMRHGNGITEAEQSVTRQAGSFNGSDRRHNFPQAGIRPASVASHVASDSHLRQVSWGN